MQKRVLRTITNSNYIAHTEPLFKELKLVKITDMYVIAIWKFYHKFEQSASHVFFNHDSTTSMCSATLMITMCSATLMI